MDVDLHLCAGDLFGIGAGRRLLNHAMKIPPTEHSCQCRCVQRDSRFQALSLVAAAGSLAVAAGLALASAWKIASSNRQTLDDPDDTAEGLQTEPQTINHHASVRMVLKQRGRVFNETRVLGQMLVSMNQNSTPHSVSLTNESLDVRVKLRQVAMLLRPRLIHNIRPKSSFTTKSRLAAKLQPEQCTIQGG